MNCLRFILRLEKSKKEERFQEEAVNILKLPPFNLYPYEVKQILKEIEK